MDPTRVGRLLLAPQSQQLKLTRKIKAVYHLQLGGTTKVHSTEHNYTNTLQNIER